MHETALSTPPRLGNVLLALCAVAYPLIVYLCLGRLEARWLALLLLAMALVRLGLNRSVAALGLAAATGVLAGFSWLGNAWLPLKLYPVAVNAFMLALFGFSLLFPPTAVERIARLREPDLPPQVVAYTRRVTQVWCGFFAFNGAAALVTTLWMSNAAWTLYNGLIAYLLMGLLAGGEWLVRRRVRRQVHGPAVAGEAHG